MKFNIGHYLDAATNDSAYTRNNPADRTVRMVNRGWQDTNGNKVVDCTIMNFAANGECAALTGNDLNFGGVSGNITQVNPATLKGRGVRENDWQWGVTVQQELIPRVSLDVGYARRWFHGFTVTDNLVRDPSQYDAWTIMAPVDSRLPGGGGYPITMYTPTAAAAARPAREYITFESDFGPERTSYWHGLDATLSARLRGGLTFQAGTSTGRKIEDDCATQVKIDSPDPASCHFIEPWLTTLRGLATYTIPKVDVLVSATMRSQPPLQLTANWLVPNTVVQSLLGRLPPGGTATGTTTVPLVDPVQVNNNPPRSDHRHYADNRRTQIDMRVAKIVRIGPTRADVGFDLGNLLNTNYATTYENNYQYSAGNVGKGGTWNNPTQVLTPRFVRLNLTVNF